MSLCPTCSKGELLVHDGKTYCPREDCSSNHGRTWYAQYLYRDRSSKDVGYESSGTLFSPYHKDMKVYEVEVLEWLTPDGKEPTDPRIQRARARFRILKRVI